jgi:predicted nucleic acid-binding protein
VADASSLVGELLRARGQDLLRHATLDLAIAEPIRDEAQHELERRVNLRIQQGRMPFARGHAVLAAALELLNATIVRVPVASYARFEDEARARIPRDPNDWPTVAAALALDAGIWTNDGDFLGCGLPTWTTETLLAYLARHPDR